MRASWWEIQAHNRDVQALADRLELRIHTVALVLTAIVLGMRLVAGTGDLTVAEASLANEGAQAPAADAAGASPL